MSLYLGNNLVSGVATPTEPTRNLGQIIESIVPLTDAGLHLLDGALIDGNGIYSAFVDYIADLYDGGNYPNLFETEANWQTSVTTYGVCGKFVYDSVNNTVRLPKITGIVEGTTDLTALGDLVEAGLPNILAKTTNSSTWVKQSSSDSISTTVDSGGYGGYGSGDLYKGHLNLDASISNSIYGNSSTVQPQTIKAFYYIVVATSTKTDIQVDIDEVATDLNGKADVDLTNVNNTGTSLGAFWAMPSDTYEDLTLGASGSTYTAPANGWFCISKVAGASSRYINVNKVTNGFGIQTHSAASLDGLAVYMPIGKNEQIRISYNATGTTNFFRFVYAKGSESEAQ